MKELEKTIFRSYVPECPCCQNMKQHTPEAWAKYHPNAGKGIQVDTEIYQPKEK